LKLISEKKTVPISRHFLSSSNSSQGCSAKKISVETHPKTSHFQVKEVWEREKRSVGRQPKN